MQDKYIGFLCIESKIATFVNKDIPNFALPYPETESAI